jgi:hypothetical protein
MKKACVIIPYFGNWPPYFNLFLKSCSYNPQLTILFFSDLTPPQHISGNVQFHYCTIEDIRSRLEKILGFEPAAFTAYKLCDARPAFALIFEEYIRSFDYWGWGDIDLLYGRLSDFHIEELMRSFDVISFKPKWVSGSFCLIRNDENINRLFFQTPDLRKIYANPRHLCFDEISFCWDQARTVDFDLIDFPSDNFTRIVRDAVKTGKITASFNDVMKESISKRGYLLWDHGRITDDAGKNYLLYHYITEKRAPYFEYPSWVNVPDLFFINRTGFYDSLEFRRRNWIAGKRILRSIPSSVGRFFSRMEGFVRKRGFRTE